jgi:hypothetical protein
MATRTEIQAVLKAIEQHEGPQPDGAFDCTNDVIVEATGLDKAVVASALHDLWKSDHIEGVLTLGGVKPYLNGIVRVLVGAENPIRPGQAAVLGVGGALRSSGGDPNRLRVPLARPRPEP